MKDKILYPLIGVVLALLVIFVYVYENRARTPVVGPDGKISGDYTIVGIERLGKPYECSFSKSDEASQVSGTIRMSENKLRGDFDLSQASSTFASHFIIIDNITYAWTSLQPVGYKSPVAKSAEKNASPTEQAQIIGTEDKENYICSPWNTDSTVFELPSGINFLELNK